LISKLEISTSKRSEDPAKLKITQWHERDFDTSTLRQAQCTASSVHRKLSASHWYGYKEKFAKLLKFGKLSIN